MLGKRLAAFLLIAIAFSGCAKGSATPTDTGPGSVIEATEGTEGGAIEGVVTDETILPIPGAMVGIQGLDGIAVTGDDGTFAFRGIPSGTYVVQANRLGYDSISKSVDVIVGETTNLQLIINPIQVKATYVDVVQLNMFMGCGGGLLVTSFTGGCAWTSTDVAEDHNVTRDVVSVVGELIWQQTAVLSSARMTLTVGHNETRDAAGFTGFDHGYASETGASPVRVMDHAKFKGITDAGSDEGLFMRFRIWTPSAADGLPLLVLEQPLTVWSSMFYGEQATEDYTALPDA